MTHITQRHKNDFNKRGITDISKYLKSTLETFPISITRNSMEYNVVYLVKGKKYTIAYGSNEIIVSAFLNK